MPRPNEDELKKKLGTASAAPAAQTGPAKSTASASTYTPAKKPVVALPKKTGTTSAELLKRAAPYMASKLAARSAPDFIASQPGAYKWYANEAPTTREMFGRIYTVTENDENRRGELLGMFETEMNSTASPYYNPYYMRGTSQAVSALEALGFQFSGDITRQTVDELRQFGDYSNYGVSGSLLAPSGKSTEAQNIAYWTNRLADAVEISDQIDTEWDALTQNITYWAQLGYSDEEVLSRIDWADYSALTGLDEGRERRTPVQTARATPYSRDTLYGVMWAARNGGGSGDYMADAAQYAMGRGNAYRRDPAAEAARDPSSQAYNPYTRCTMDEARMYFGQSEFDAKWLEDNRALLASGDAVAAKLWQRVYDAQQNTDAALAELEALEVVVGRYSERGMAADKILARIDLEKDYPTLYRMEQARLRGDALALTRPVGFTMPYFTDWVEEVARPELVEDTRAETPMPKSIPDAPSGIMSEYWGWLDPSDTAGISESAKPEGPGPTRPPSPDPTQAPQGEKPAADLRPSAAPPPSANAHPEPQAASARTFKYWDWLGSQIGTEVEQPASESAAMLAGESANQYDPLTDRAEGTVFTWAAFDQSAQYRASVSDISARQFNGELLQSSVDFVNGNGDGNGWTDKYSELLNDIAQGSMFITSVNRGFGASGAAFGGDYMASEDTALSATSLALGKKAYEILKTAHDSPYITQDEYVQLAMTLTRHLETAESSGMTLEEYYGANETASAELDMTGQQIKWHEEQAKQAQELDIMRQQQKHNEYIGYMHEAVPAFVAAMDNGTSTQEQAEFVSFIRSIDAGAVGSTDDLYNVMRGEIGRISEWEQILPGGQSSVERFGGAYATSYSSSIQLEAMSMLDADMQMAAAMGISLNDYYERFPEERKTPDQLARSAASSVDATFSAFRDAFMEEYQDRARAEEEALYATYESATASSESRAEAQTETGKGIGPWRAVGYGAWAGTNETVYGVLNGIDYYTVQSFKRVSNEMIRLTYTRQEYAEYLRQGIANISDPEEREAAQALWDNAKDIYDVNIIFNEDSFHRDLKTLADNAESTRQYVYENGTEHEIWSFDQTANIVSNLELMAITMMAGSAATAMGVAGTGTAFGITSAVYGLPEGAEYSQRLEAQGARWDMATAAGLGKAAITGIIETAGLKVFTPRPISLMGTTLSESFRNYVSSSVANKYARTFVRSAAHFAVNTVSESMQEYLERAMGGLYERYATLAATSQEPDEDFWAAVNRIADESGAAFWDSLVSSAALSLFGGGADYVMTKRAQNQAMQGVAEATGQTVSSVEAQLDALMNARAVNDRQQGIEILFDAYAAAEAPAAAQRSVEMAKEYLAAQLTMGAFFNLSDTISRGELGAQMEQAQTVMERAEGAVKEAEQKVNAARDRWGEAEAALLADPANQQLIQANSMMLDAFVVAKQAVQKVAQEAQAVRAQYETIKAQINAAYSELVEALRTEAVVEAERIIAEERAAQEAADDSDMFLPFTPTVPVQTAQEAAGGAESLSSSEDGQTPVQPAQTAPGAAQAIVEGQEQSTETEGLVSPAEAEAMGEPTVPAQPLETDTSQAKTPGAAEGQAEQGRADNNLFEGVDDNELRKTAAYSMQSIILTGLQPIVIERILQRDEIEYEQMRSGVLRVPASEIREAQAVLLATNDALDALDGTQAQPVEPKAAGESARPAKTPGTGLNVGYVHTADNQKIAFHYELVDAFSVVASNIYNTMRENPAYPSELQPRDRTRVTSEDQVDAIARDLNADRLMDSAEVTTGAPIVGSDYAVESGNGRAMAIQRALKTGGAKAEAYVNALRSNADRLGLDANQITPTTMLVRVRDTEVSDRAEFARQSNVSTTASYSATENADTDAVKISSRTLSLYAPSESGRFDNPGNMDFLYGFLKDAIPANERNAMITPKGDVSKALVIRAQNAVFQRAYEDKNLTVHMSETTDPEAKNVLSAMLNVAARVAMISDNISEGALHDIDFSGDLSEAANEFILLKRTGESVRDWLVQENIFGTSDLVKSLVELMESLKRSSARMSGAFNRMLDRVESAGNPNQLSIIDTHIPNKQEIVNDIKAEIDESALRANPESVALEVVIDAKQSPSLPARTSNFINDVQPYRETGRATDDPQGFAHERIKAKYDASAAAREAQTAQQTQTEQPAQDDIQAMQGPAGHPVLQPDQQTAQAGKSGGQEVSNPIQIVRGLARSMGIGTALGAHKHVTVPRSVRGYYQQSSRLIWARPGSAMDEAVTMHELGHALSARTGMTATDAMVNALPQAFAEAYRPNELPGEAFAEFVRAYMTDPARAATMAGQQFVDNFEQAMRSAGVDRAVRDARDQLQAFMDATTADRIRSVVIDRSEANKRSGGIREKTRRFITTWLDRTQPAVQFDTAVGANRVNSLLTAARYREHHQGIADRLLNVDFINAFGEIVGESLADRFEGLVRGRDGFQQAVDYQLILHAIDRANVRPAEGANAAQQPGKRVFSDTVATIPELVRRAAQMRAENPNLPAASKAMSGWWHDVMQNLMVDTGLMEQGTLDLFESLFPHYVPTSRVFTEEGSGAGGQRRYSLLNAVGSDLEIINPMDQMVANLNRIVKMVADQRVLRTFDDLYQANPGMSMFAHEIPADTEVNRVSRDSVMQALTDAAQAAGTDLNAALGDDVMDAILNALDPYTIEMRRTNTATGPQELTVVRLDGTRAHYKIDDPLLFQLLANNGPRAAKTGFEIAGRVTRAMTMLTTGANPRFALKNLIRDFQKSVNYGSWAVTYLDGIPHWLRAAADVAFNRGEFQTYRAMGGGGWTRIDTTSESGTGKYRGDLIQGYKSGAARLGEGAAKLVTFEWLNNIIETTSRYVEYRRSKHDKTTEAGRVAAFIDAQEVTVDFRQSGNGQGIRALRQLMPFLNANLQGAYQTARMFTRAERDRLAPRLAKTILNNALMGTLAVALILKYGSDDDREGYALLDDDIKAKNIILPTHWFIGDGFLSERPFVRLPVSQDALAQAAYAAGVWAAGRVEGETEFSLDMKAVAKSILANTIPDSTILSPVVDVLSNTSWTGSPIVPARLEGAYTTHQSYESTPEAFIAVSRALTSMFGENKLFSPLALQYLAEQYTGFLGQMAIPALSRDTATGEWSGELALRNVMASWRNSLTIDPAYTNEVTDLYYHNRELLNQVRSAGKGGLSADMLRPGLPDSDYTQAYEEATEMLASDGLIYNTDQTISDMYEEIAAINADPNISLHAKAMQVREIRMEMVRVLQSANEQLTDYNQRYVERDTMAESFRAMGGNPVIVPLTELEKLPQVFLDDGDAEYMAFVAETYTNDQTATLPHINRSFSADRVEYEVGDAQWGEFQIVYRDAYRDYMEDPRKGYLPGMTPEERAEVLDKAHNAAWNAAKKWYIDFAE